MFARRKRRKNLRKIDTIADGRRFAATAKKGRLTRGLTRLIFDGASVDPLNPRECDKRETLFCAAAIGFSVSLQSVTTRDQKPSQLGEPTLTVSRLLRAPNLSDDVATSGLRRPLERTLQCR
jgi:hypothetical protein